jgi:sialic acid synthase SpsE
VKPVKQPVAPGAPCYLIAEISHNHQGDENEVKKIIEAAAKSGASAVKFQKRDNKTLFTEAFYNKPYENANSFGKTYGAHREFLEPKLGWLKKANSQAHQAGLDFIMTVFDTNSLALCEKELKIDKYKIQSADLTSHYLIEKIAATGKPYFISCGAASVKEIKSTYRLCKKLRTPFCLMYAVSEYPTKDAHVNLRRITYLKKSLKTGQIGFSCHHTSIEPAVFSRVLGAVAIEKHFTLNKKQKGPDHQLSLTPAELKELRKRLTAADLLMGHDWETRTSIEAYQHDARYKMGKSATVIRDLKKGDKLKEEYLRYQSPMEGSNPMQVGKLIGKPLKKAIRKGTVL